MTPGAGTRSPPDPMTVLRSPGYVGILVAAGLLGVPVAAIAYGYLQLAAGLQEWLLTGLPRAIGLGEPPGGRSPCS